MNLLLNKDYPNNILTNNVKIFDDCINECIQVDSFTKMFVFVAYAKTSGVKKLINFLNQRDSKNKFEVNIYVGFSQQVTTYDALARLLGYNDVNKPIKLFYICPKGITFHSKVFLFSNNKDKCSIIIGSSNLTKGGFCDNIETGIQIDNQPDLFENVIDYFTSLNPRQIPDIATLDTLNSEGFLSIEKTSSYKKFVPKGNRANGLYTEYNKNNILNKAALVVEVSPNSIVFDEVDLQLDTTVQYLWCDAWPYTGPNKSQMQMLKGAESFFENRNQNSPLTIRLKFFGTDDTSYSDHELKFEANSNWRIIFSRPMLVDIHYLIDKGYNIIIFSKTETVNHYELQLIKKDTNVIGTLVSLSTIFKKTKKKSFGIIG